MSFDHQAMLDAFLRTITAWHLDESVAGSLIGVAPSVVAGWRVGKPLAASEEVMACISMVVRIQTALDICWSAPLANQWMTRPNDGQTLSGTVSVEICAQHGWPGLFSVLCQVPAWAVGNW